MPPAHVSILSDAPDCALPGSSSSPSSSSDDDTYSSDSQATSDVSPVAVGLPYSSARAALSITELVYEILRLIPSPARIAICRSVGRTWRRAGSRALKGCFEINVLLAAYFTDVLGFRRVQCELDVLISGSFALAFFREHGGGDSCTLSPTSDMDLFVEWTLAEDLEVYLIQDGYRVLSRFDNPMPNSSSTPPLNISIPDDSFVRVVRYERGDRHIDVVCTTCTPVYCVFSFHSTVVMNFITWSHAFCMFPVETLINNRGLVLRLNNDRTRRAIDKYSGRGYQMLQWNEGPTDDFRGSFHPGYRWVGDSTCWTVKLDVARVINDIDPYSGELEAMAVESDYPYGVNGFMFDYEPAHGPTMTGDLLWYPRQECDLITHGSLLYSYAAGADFLAQVFRYLHRRAHWYGERLRHRGVIYYIDSRLQYVKKEFIRCNEDSSAVPDDLYG